MLNVDNLYWKALIRCSGATRSLSQAGNLAEGAHWLALWKKLKKIVNPHVNGYTKTWNHRKPLRKSQKTSYWNTKDW